VSYLQAYAISQIALDVLALLVTVYFTGGLRSPVLCFFVFHMAIGTMLLSVRTMYAIAAITSASIFTLYLLEEYHLLPHRPLAPAGIADSLTADLNMVTVMVAVFGTVYLTGTVTRRFKRRTIELLETTIQLGDRTRELERVLGEIQELERRKSHYMRISAHHLRSPLGTIKTSLQVLDRGLADASSERGQKLLKGAVERADGLLAIVNDLLELAKIREGQAKAPWTRHVSVNQIVREVLQRIRPFAEKRKVRLHHDLTDAATLDWGVPPDLQYAIENIVNNAIKYSKAGGDVRIAVKRRNGKAVLTVTDQGIGIPPDLVDDVFLEFVRAPNAKHHTGEGTGLGLSIVKEVIEKHGGTITLQSDEGGTTASIAFVLANQPPAATSTRPQAPPAPAFATAAAAGAILEEAQSRATDKTPT
jgi:signal transduction histidine kinase